MRHRVFTIGLICFGLASSISVASAQSGVDGPACWAEYAECAQQSVGDDNWRSICYADFTKCLGRKALPSCIASAGPKVCSDYLAECKALAPGDAVWAAQCLDDQDTCELAYGC